MSRPLPEYDSAAERRADELEIRWAIENWVVWRDAGAWDRFATLWHPEGRMFATWFQASATEFIARAKFAASQGMKGVHMLGGTSVEMAGERAVAQTKMQILQRGLVHDVEVDITCWGRFFDFFERVDGRWLLYIRQPIYELDRMTPVNASVMDFKLDRETLDAFPEGYRHLAYLQSLMGFPVKRDMPGLQGPEVEALLARGDCWLRGGSAEP